MKAFYSNHKTYADAMRRLEYETKTNYRHSWSVLGKQVSPWLDSIQKQKLYTSITGVIGRDVSESFCSRNDTYEKHIRTHLKEKLKFVALELILLLYRTREPLLIEAWMPWKRRPERSVKIRTPLFLILKHPVLEEIKKNVVRRMI